MISFLGEKAAIEGCGSNRILSFEAQIQHLMYEKKHAKAMAMYDTKLCQKYDKNYTIGYINAMKEASYDHALELYQKGCSEALMEWTEDLTELVQDKTNHELLDEKINAISLDISKEFKSECNISANDLYSSLAKLRTLVDYQTFEKFIDDDEMTNFFKNDIQAYDYFKPITEQRLKMLATIPKMDLNQGQNKSPMKSRIVRAKQIKTTAYDICQNLIFEVCELGRQNEDFNFVYKNISNLDSLKDQFNLESQKIKNVERNIHYQKSLLFWSWGQENMAIKMMKGHIKNIRENPIFLADSLIKMASWLWSSRSENANVILDDYYIKAMEIYEKTLENAEKGKLLGKYSN